MHLSDGEKGTFWETIRIVYKNATGCFRNILLLFYKIGHIYEISPKQIAEDVTQYFLKLGRQDICNIKSSKFQ